MRRWTWLLLLAVVTASLTRAAAVRGEAPAKPPAEPSVTDGAAASGIGFLRPGAWGLLHTFVDNPTDSPLHALVATSFKDQSNLQFGTEISLPPMSRRDVWQPVRAPEHIRGDGRAIEDQSLLLDTSGSRDTGAPGRPGLVRLDADQPVMGLLAGGDDEAVDMVIAAKIGAGLSKRASYINTQALPSFVSGLDGLDTLVMAGIRAPLDAAQIQTVRDWVLSGGRLWVLLDRTDPELARQVLRDDWTIQIIDRVELTHVAITGGSPSPRRDFEQPVELVRVAAPGMEVVHRVNGWPASMRRRVGEGWVTVTTLGPRGWQTPWGFANDSLREVGDVAIRRRPAPPLPAAALEHYLSAQIGYKIIGRPLAAGILGVMVVGLLVSGLWLARSNRLEFAGVIGPVLAVIVAAVLLVMGMSHRHDTPLTVASAQLVRVVPSQQAAVVNGMLSVYSPDPGMGPIEAVRGGVVWPDMTGQGQTLLRMVWSDFDKWQWQRLTLPAGAVRPTQVWDVIPLAGPVAVRIGFDETGLVGAIEPGPFKNIRHAMLVTPAGRMTVRFFSDNTLQAAADDTLTSDHFAPANSSDADVKLREAVYQRLLTEPDPSEPGRVIHTDYPTVPTLLAWVDTVNIGIQLVQDSQRRESALMAVPVTFVRPAPGSTVRIPSPLLPFTVLRGLHHQGGKVFDPLRRTWLEINNGADPELRFELPKEVTPFRTTAGRLMVTLRAPGRTFEAFGYQNGQAVSLGKHDGPLGTVVFESPDGSGFEAGPDGLVEVKLVVGETVGEGEGPMWRMEDVRLELTGVVGEKERGVKRDER